MYKYLTWFGINAALLALAAFTVEASLLAWPVTVGIFGGIAVLSFVGVLNLGGPESVWGKTTDWQKFKGWVSSLFTPQQETMVPALKPAPFNNQICVAGLAPHLNNLHAAHQDNKVVYIYTKKEQTAAIPPAQPAQQPDFSDKKNTSQITFEKSYQNIHLLQSKLKDNDKQDKPRVKKMEIGECTNFALLMGRVESVYTKVNALGTSFKEVLDLEVTGADLLKDIREYQSQLETVCAFQTVAYGAVQKSNERGGEYKHFVAQTVFMIKHAQSLMCVMVEELEAHLGMSKDNKAAQSANC